MRLRIEESAEVGDVAATIRPAQRGRLTAQPGRVGGIAQDDPGLAREGLERLGPDGRGPCAGGTGYRHLAVERVVLLHATAEHRNQRPGLPMGVQAVISILHAAARPEDEVAAAAHVRREMPREARPE